MRLFIKLVFIGFTFYLFENCTFTKAGRAEKDIRLYFKAIRDYHVEPYARISKDSLLHLEDSLVRICRNLHREEDVIKLLLQTRQYFDGHTGIVFKWKKPTYIYEFPIEAKEEYLYWKPTEERIVSIDTFNAEKYLEEIRKMIPYDCVPKGIQKWIENYEFYLLLNSLEPPRYIQLVKEDGEIYQIPFPKKLLLHKQTSYNEYQFGYFPEDSIAVFCYNTCVIRDVNKFTADIRTFFDEIGRLDIKHLFVDIRHNGGGNSMNNNVFLPYFAYKRNTIKKEFYKSKKGYEKFVETYYQQVPYDEKMQKVVEIILANEEYVVVENKEIEEKLEGYKGNIYVLQGPGTYSAALEVAWYLKIATPHCWLIGDMVGQYNPLCGNIAVIELPYANTYMTIATTKNLTLHGLPEENGFLLPDIPFEFGISEEVVDIEELKEIIREVEQYKTDKI